MSRKIVVFGLTVTSWRGDEHAATYRALLRELHARGHHVTFVERDLPSFANHRDLPEPTFCDLALYSGLEELRGLNVLDDADLAIVGGGVPEGVEVGEWVLREARCPVAFYDLDTPVTLAKLELQDYEYLTPKLVGRYAIYLSSTGGPTLHRIESKFGSPRALPLYGSVDPTIFYPELRPKKWDLGYAGSALDDRQPTLERLMLDAAREWREGRFAVAGPNSPESVGGLPNVERIEPLLPSELRAFSNSQRFALNLTLPAMVRAGWSPSVRLFEAAACGVPIVGEFWEGLDQFFSFGKEILVSRGPEETLGFLRDIPEWERYEIGEAARRRVSAEHTAAHRAEQLEQYMERSLATRAITLR